MIQLNGDFVFFGTIAGACLASVMLGKQLWTALLAGFGVTMVGWILLVAATQQGVVMERNRLDRLAAQGVKLTMSDQMYDGTGENMAGVCIGWLPGAFGTMVGVVISLCIWPPSWRRQQRVIQGFDVVIPPDR